MSERILKALMQLFAIIADVDDLSNKSRHIVENFLKQQLNQEMVDEYLKIYDEYLEAHHKISKKKDSRKKRTSLNSVKVLRICTQINEELAQKQKVIVLIRILEYVYSDQSVSEQEMEFVSTVAEAFNISKEEFDDCFDFVKWSGEAVPNSATFLLINGNKEINPEAVVKHIYAEGMEDERLLVLSVISVGMYVLKYIGTSELYLNGQIISANRSYILTQGSSLRSSKVLPVYYSDIISSFLSDKSESKIDFVVDNIVYKFKGGKIGLQPLNFHEQSGTLAGIMGGSGAGKSTLLNVLNSNNAPSEGGVYINGVNIHTEKDEIEGVIGYVSQDDLLIEELTVFQNLFYNAKLCFAEMSDSAISKLVLDTLSSLGLLETKDLKVGSPLEKTISGGQRKRLNIALELIREPSVMFVDEPTSGLSSRDSENIMDLLKELALKGKLIFVVIHQPSSDIFKMFDKLLILDVGGYPIYFGNPVDAVIYFKKQINHVNADESECHTCGNVNPEQIFNIIESKVLDEYGNLTDNRKILPKEWNELYLKQLEEKVPDAVQKTEIPKSTFSVPNKLKQFKVFITRDVLSKLTNKQYLMINLLEAPALALILSYFVKFYRSDASNEAGYVFFQNENLVAYMFMSVVVALFLGLTVSAEEIIRDQKIRKRESFLHLSNGSYLLSKILIMFTLSAIQTFSFILVGNLVLGIHGMFLDYFLILFSAACFANMLGLNISASFNSAVTIYILIPFLIIPQLLFSGVIVKFEKLNPTITSQTHVPMIGESMASRWAFEALAVNQFKNNEYEKRFYKFNQDMSVANYHKNFWIPELRAKIGIVESAIGKAEKEEKEKLEDGVALLNHELEKHNEQVSQLKFDKAGELTSNNITPEIIEELKAHIEKLNKYYIKKYNASSDALDNEIREIQSTEKGKEAYTSLKNDYENESLSDLVRNKNDFSQIIEVDNQLIQRTDPVYLDSDRFRAHFFAPTKVIFGKRMNTFWANILILWSMCLILAIMLYFDVLRKLIEGLGKLFGGH